MYLSGVGAPIGTNDKTASGSLARPLGTMSKRFDVKDEPGKAQSSSNVRLFLHSQSDVLRTFLLDTYVDDFTHRRKRSGSRGGHVQSDIRELGTDSGENVTVRVLSYLYVYYQNNKNCRCVSFSFLCAISCLR